MRLFLALVVVMSTGLIAALGSVAAVGNECAGLQTCIDVPGPGTGGPEARLALVPCMANDDHEWALVEKSEW